jgi:uncharacterized protein (DUF427 family)
MIGGQASVERLQDRWEAPGSATHENLAWCYEYPTPAAVKVAGRICFYDEKVDVYINGERQKRPQTPFS